MIGTWLLHLFGMGPETASPVVDHALRRVEYRSILHIGGVVYDSCAVLPILREARERYRYGPPQSQVYSILGDAIERAESGPLVELTHEDVYFATDGMPYEELVSRWPKRRVN